MSVLFVLICLMIYTLLFLFLTLNMSWTWSWSSSSVFRYRLTIFINFIRQRNQIFIYTANQNIKKCAISNWILNTHKLLYEGERFILALLCSFSTSQCIGYKIKVFTNLFYQLSQKKFFFKCPLFRRSLIMFKNFISLS